MFNLLLDGQANSGNDIWSWVIIGVMVVAIIVMFIVSNRKNKKKQEEAQALVDAVKPGNKVKTIGGICGIVVEIDGQENTFVLETGSEETGKSYIKFMKEAIYQTDAVPEKKDATVTETDPVEEKVEEKVENQPEEKSE